jgi:hypothetical protein
MDLPLLFEAGVMVKYMHKIIGRPTQAVLKKFDIFLFSFIDFFIWLHMG